MCMTVDCSDPNCTAAGYACVAAIPVGWTGYYTVFEGKPANDPGCPMGVPNSAYVGNKDLVAPPATCSTCTCNAPTGQQCTWPAVGPGGENGPIVGDAACNGSTFCSFEFTVPSNWNGSCVNDTYLQGGQTTCGSMANMTCSANTGAACNVSVTMPSPTVIGGTCTASMQNPTLPPITWNTVAEACNGAPAVPTGCNAGLTCLQKPATPYVPGICISQTGDKMCPAGVFSQKHLYFQNVTDSRACSGCGCGGAGGATCSASVQLYSDLQLGVCNTLIGTVASGSCTNIAGNPNVAGKKATITGPTGGTCPPSGGQASGTAVGASPTTFCCIP
jgi:hypothetical protein